MTARPYFSSTVAELQELANQFGNDPDGRAALIAELTHRTTPSARRLLSELENRVPTALARPPAASPPPATSPLATPNRDLTSRYEALRAAFTTEAEFLARWGMTPAMPDDLRSEVYAWWERRLGASADELGRSLASLVNDRSRADRERAL